MYELLFYLLFYLSYGSYLHDHRSKVVKLGSGWFCRQKFSHYLPCKKRHLFEGPRNSQALNLWFVGLGLVRWVHLKWSRVNTVINYNGVYFFVNWTELGSLIMKCWSVLVVNGSLGYQ